MDPDPSEWLWVALWDFLLSVDELCLSATGPILELVGEGWLDQSFYLLFSLLRLLAGY